MKLIMIIGGIAQGKHAFAATTFPEMHCIDDRAEAVRRALEAGRDPQEETRAFLKSLRKEQQDTVLIYPEVGSGVVPMDPEERAWREAVGRAGCIYAAEADEVYRMVSGIAQKIK